MQTVRQLSTIQPYLLWNRSVQVGLGLLLLQVPLVSRHFWGLIQRPQYRYVPLVLAVVIGLIIMRLRRRRPEEMGQGSRGERILLGSGLLALAAASLLMDPWLAMVALLLTAGGVLRYISGRSAWSRIWPIWLLAWLVVPLPPQLDAGAQELQQRVVIRLASVVLDARGIDHLPEATAIYVPRRVVTAEFSRQPYLLLLTAFAAVFAIYARRPPIPSALLIAAGAMWGVLAAAAHLFCAVALGPQLASQAGVSAVIWVVALLMIGSTDALLYLLFGPVIAAPGESRPNALSTLWNRHVAGLSAEDLRRSAVQLDLDRTLDVAAAADQADEPTDQPLRTWLRPAILWPAALCAVLQLALGGLAWSRLSTADTADNVSMKLANWSGGTSGRILISDRHTWTGLRSIHALPRL